MTVRKAVVALLAGAAIAASAVAYAHPGGWGMGGDGYGPGYGMMGGGHGHGMMWGNGPGRDDGDYAAYADARMERFKSYLGISAAQDGAWQAFVKQSKQQAKMDSSAAALKDLYAALTPEQRALLDQRGPGRRGQR